MPLPKPTSRARVLTLVATALGSALAFLDTTVVVVALPQMEADLGLGLDGQQWVYLSYAVTLAALYLPSGALGDRFGLRRTFALGVLMFAFASTLCALAPSESALLAGRSLQGVGGAALTTTSLALLRVVWAGEAGRAIGLWTSLTSLATIGGPPLGGVLVDLASWRWVFLVNLPLAAVVLVLTWLGRSPAGASHERRSLDVVGASLGAVGLAGISFAIVEGGDRPPAVTAPIGLAAACALVALVGWVARSREPVVPSVLLRAPGLVAANVVTFLAYAPLSASVVFLPVYAQFLGLSPAAAGLVFATPSLGLFLLAPRFGRIADRHGPRLPIGIGLLGVGGSLLLLLPIDERSDVWVWGVAETIVFACFLPAVVTPITAAALAPAPEALAGVASGLNQTVARIGGLVAVAAIGAVAAAVFAAAGGAGDAPFAPALSGPDHAAGVQAFHAVIGCAAALSLGAGILALTVLRGSSSATEPGRQG